MPGRRFFLLLVPLFVAGCTVNQSMTLKSDFTGTAGVSISLHDFFVEYLQNLADTVAGPADGRKRAIFDLDQIEFSFSMQPELALLSAKSSSPGNLELSIRHGAPDKVFTIVPGASGVFTVSRSGGTATLRFRLDRKNFDSLARLLPLYETGKSLYLFPDPANPMSEEEYLDYLAWAFEGTAAGTDVRQVLRSSVVKVRIEVKGTLVSQTGGTATGNAAEFSIPVLRALTLEKPIEFSVTIRP